LSLVVMMGLGGGRELSWAGLGDQDTRGRGAGQHMAHRQCWSWGSLWTLGTGQLGSKLSSAEGHYGHGWDFLEMFRGSQPLLDLLLVHVPPRA
jgi:hypothetical protein